VFIKANPLEFAKPKLSDYGFFREPMAEQIPLDNIFPYRISTELFKDYAFKSRFIVLPEGEKISYIGSEEFDFPVGTIFIKTFYYPADFRACAMSSAKRSCVAKGLISARTTIRLFKAS